MKNEEHIIAKCLESVYKYINYWTIADTGSTDNSCQIVTDFFKDKNIPGQLLHHEWKGFAHNRSLVFEAAESKSDWLYVIDCDDYLLTPLIIPPGYEDADSLIVLLEEGEFTTQNRQQVFKSGLKWGFAGAVHEFPFSRVKKSLHVLKTDQIKVRASRGGDRSKDPLKYWKDAQLMEKDLLRIENIPKNKLPHWEVSLKERYYHYIAQSYFDFHEYAECIKWCEKRIKVHGFIEEQYRAFLMKARSLRGLRAPHKDVIKALEDTRKNDPYRSEHLFELAVEYEKMEMEEGQKIEELKKMEPTDESVKPKIVQAEKDKKLYLQKAWENIDLVFKIKRPKDKLFIVEDYVYTFGKKDKASSIAHRLGKYEAAYKYANLLYYECQEKRQLTYSYHLKHKNIPHLVQMYTKYVPVKINACSTNNIVFNIAISNSAPCWAQETVSSFLATVLDYINIDGWYYTLSDENVDKNEFQRLFPFFKQGRETGKKMTINVDDSRIFFHKTYLIDYLSKIDVVKILYLNRNGEDELFPSEAPKGMHASPDGSSGTITFISMNTVKKSPHVVFSKGMGIWSTDFLTSVQRT